MSKTHKPGGVKPPMDLSALVSDVMRRPEPIVIGSVETSQGEPKQTKDNVIAETGAGPHHAIPLNKQPIQSNQKLSKPAPQPKTSSQTNQYPWQMADNRIVSGYNVRLREPLHEKMRWIVANAPGKRSIQTLVVDAIEAECARILDGMGIEKTK